MTLHERVAALLAARGKTASPVPGKDYRLQDDGDGPYIAGWNAAALGPRPVEADGFTAAELEDLA